MAVKNRAVLYMRISKEDTGRSESASIETQRKILTDYAEKNGFEIVGEYADDGYSGTSMERPALRRMLSELSQGRADTVLIKDLSRLGRNSGRVSILLDEYFPSRRIRLIAVADGVDTFKRDSAASIVTPVKNLVNELYAADISMKIRSSLGAKMRRGEYIGAFAPYGYEKDGENKNRLIIDGAAAEVVRNIFGLAAGGKTPSQIAAELNGGGVPTPSAYRLEKNPQLCSSFKAAERWSAGAVGKILRNEVYLGHTVQGKSVKAGFKSKRILSVPKDERIVVKDTHEAIVDEKTWVAVRRRMSERASARGEMKNIFSGIAKCADCGRNMSSARGGRLVCGGYKAGGRAVCTAHAVDCERLKADTGVYDRDEAVRRIKRIYVYEGGEVKVEFF